MIEFIAEDFHRDFIEYCVNQLNDFSIKFHNNCREINFINDRHLDNYNLYVKYNVSYKTNFILEFRKKIKYIEGLSDDESLFINDYNRLVDLTILNDNIAYLIKTYSTFILINSYIYTIIQRAINHQIQILLLKGVTFHLPRIGTLQIIRVPYDSSKPDWGRSYEFKRMLEEQGYETKANNNNGKNWFVDNGLNRDDFFILRWRKKYSNLKNKKPYKFKASKHGNIYGKRISHKKIPLEKLHDLTSGLFDKIIHIYRHHYEYGREKYPFINSKSNENDN